VRALVTAARELWGLFVEDASLSAGVLICLALAVYVFPLALRNPEWRGGALFVIVAAVLIENVCRSARRAR
jgi:hypothetical protein